MSKGTAYILENTIKGTFRDMAGISSQFAEDGKEEDVPYTNIFIIDSFNPEECSLQFFFPLELKRRLVEGILKTSWTDLTHQYIDDCLLEIVNIIGGNFFCQHYHQRQYEIGLPYMAFDDSRLAKGTKYFFDSEGIVFCVTLVKD